MSFQPSLAQSVKKWVEDNKQEFRSMHVMVNHASVEGEQFPNGKAIVRFKHPKVLMQIDLWGTGHADVMILQYGRIKEFHKKLPEEIWLPRFLNEQWRVLRRLIR